MSLHLDIPTRPEIAGLMSAREPACVSIYLPTSPLPQDAGAARIGFKNLAGEAVDQLGGDRRTAAAVREQLDDLLEDDGFWDELATGLAAFATPESVRTFRLPTRLSSIVEVSDRFHLKPLLRSVTFPHAAFVLAIAQGSVRLIEVAPDVAVSEVSVADLPRDLAAVAATDRSQPGRIIGDEGQKVRMRQYARRVDRALRPTLAGLGLPLILAAAEPLYSIYRSVNSYAGLAPEGIAGNPEQTPDAELAESARAVLDAIYAAELAELHETFAAREPQGRAATDLTDVARAATMGAVDTLLADMDAVVPGYVDEASGAVTLDSEHDARNYGVIDELARRVLEHGGRVLAVRGDDVPGAGAVAAVLRYPA